MIKTGIFGGSFNPIHIGHIKLARQLRQAADMDEVWLMVSPQNPLKQQTDLLADQLRLDMARRAVASEPGIVASDYEFHLPRPSYTWNTLQQLEHDFPNREFTLMIGGDNWHNFQRWYRAADILQRYKLVVSPRRGSDIGQQPDSSMTGLRAKGITIVEAELLDISSTDIRQRVSEHSPITGMVPPCIEADVERYYSNDNNTEIV